MPVVTAFVFVIVVNVVVVCKTSDSGLINSETGQIEIGTFLNLLKRESERERKKIKYLVIFFYLDMI